MERRATTADPPRRDRTARADPSAWVDRHGDALFRYALLHCGQHDTAEDLVQDTLLAALRARDAYRGESAERTWLIGILKHKVADLYRRRAARRDRAAPDDALADEPAQARPWTESPESLLEREAFWETLYGCVTALPERMAEAFCLRDIQCLGADEICQILNVTPTNLWALLHRARRRLRTCLDRRWFGTRMEGKP